MKQKTRKVSISLDPATGELLKRYMEEKKLELLMQGVGSIADLVRAAILNYLRPWLEENPEILKEYIASQSR